MNVIVKKWLAYAKADLEAADILIKNPRSSYSHQLAVIHCHQAIEKILKTVITANGDEVKKYIISWYWPKKVKLNFLMILYITLKN